MHGSGLLKQIDGFAPMQGLSRQSSEFFSDDEDDSHELQAHQVSAAAAASNNDDQTVQEECESAFNRWVDSDVVPLGADDDPVTWWGISSECIWYLCY
jgi:hypothetical protein